MTLTVLVSTALLAEVAIRRGTGGELIYPLDDTYIQMAIAKNLARDGIWGVASQYANAGSSIAWPLLLAGAYAVVGLNDVIPLLFNIVAAIVLVVMVVRFAEAHGATALEAAALAGLVSVPIVSLYRIGMEHTLACVAVLGSAVAVARVAAGTRPLSLAVLGAGAVLMAVRYDLAAVAAPLLLALLVCQGWRAGLSFVALSAVPVGLAALSATSHGWPLLPTPVLLKHRLVAVDAWSLDGLATVAGGGWSALMASPALLVIAILCLGLIATARGEEDGRARELRILQLITVLAVLLHVNFGRTGPPSRYTAPLVVLGTVAIAADLRRVTRSIAPNRRWAAGALAAIYVGVVAVRGYSGATRVIELAHGVYDYEYQLADFFRRRAPGQGIVLGDVGAVAYQTDVPLVDVQALLTPELLPAARRHEIDHATTSRLASDRGIKISLVPLAEWSCVGAWQFADWKTPFYAADEETAVQLSETLRAAAEEDGAPVAIGDEACEDFRD